MTEAEEVLDALIDDCRFIAGGVCRKHGCGVRRESPEPGAKRPRWRCMISGEYMSTSRDRNRERRRAKRRAEQFRKTVDAGDAG